MSINRHNYEEFFILYLDNELSSEDRRQVELFVLQHPDLGEELQLLEQTRLELDPTIVFEAKESLMKPVGLGWINADNQEEWLVQYIDNELVNEQKAAVEIYVANNPSVKAELELLQKTILRPEGSIVFPYKESLYRREESSIRRLFPVRLWKVAAAILLLIALTIGGIAIFKTNRTPGKDLVITKDNPDKTSPVIGGEKKEGIEKQPIIASTSSDPVKEEQVNNKKVNELAVSKKTPVASPAITKESVEKEQPVIAEVEIKNPNNLPIQNRNMNGSLKNDAVIADIDNKALTDLIEKSTPPLVTSGTAQSFIQAKNMLPEDPDEGGMAMNEPEKKTKFRGLLRTLTRTFEKTTNIKATDDDDRLLVAGLAIRL